MLLEVNSHMTELGSDVNNQLDVLEIVPMQQLLGGESHTTTTSVVYQMM